MKHQRPDQRPAGQSIEARILRLRFSAASEAVWASVAKSDDAILRREVCRTEGGYDKWTAAREAARKAHSAAWDELQRVRDEWMAYYSQEYGAGPDTFPAIHRTSPAMNAILTIIRTATEKNTPMTHNTLVSEDFASTRAFHVLVQDGVLVKGKDHAYTLDLPRLVEQIEFYNGRLPER